MLAVNIVHIEAIRLCVIVEQPLSCLTSLSAFNGMCIILTSGQSPNWMFGMHYEGLADMSADFQVIHATWTLLHHVLSFCGLPGCCCNVGRNTEVCRYGLWA